jgi:hypothetical protein
MAGEETMKGARSNVHIVRCEYCAKGSSSDVHDDAVVLTTAKVTIMQPDPLLGHLLVVRSIAGIVYRGVVRSIRPADDLGELFELGSDTNAKYQRYIHVVDRTVQIREIHQEPDSKMPRRLGVP